MPVEIRLRGVVNAVGSPADVLIRDGRIVAIEPAGEGRADAGGVDRFLLSPLLDLQHNGCLGRAFNNPAVTVDELRRRRAFLLEHGTAYLLPTLITAPLERMTAALANLAAARRADPDLAAAFCGFHIEGPWLSAADGYRGAHNREWMRDPTWDDFAGMQEAAEGLIRIVTLAPERAGALGFIERLAEAGVTVSLAHCNPDDATVRAAVAAGARMVTHLGNGMASTIHRHNNPLWSYLAQERLSCGLIADGFHVPDPLLRTALRAKGRQAFLVSDASDLSGLPPGEYPYEYQQLVIEPSGRLGVKGTEYLAGAWFQLDHGVARAVSALGLSRCDAWRAASAEPARIMGLACGEPLRLGGPADVVVARWADELRIERVYLGGRLRVDGTGRAAVAAAVPAAVERPNLGRSAGRNV
jgi:N-acetylglucosamine-6-phosphate deacetylase